MSVSMKNEFQISATPGEELSRHLAYLAAQDNGSVLTGGFIKDAAALEREGSDRAGQQAATTMEFLARQEQLRQQRLAELSNRLDALEQAAHDALIDAENDLAEILSNANRDRNGRAVFQDQDGNIRNEDGEIVDPADVDMSEWDSDRPSWTELTEARTATQSAAEFYDRVQEAKARSDVGELDDEVLSILEGDLDAMEAELASFSARENEGAHPVADNSGSIASPAPSSSGDGPAPLQPF